MVMPIGPPQPADVSGESPSDSITVLDVPSAMPASGRPDVRGPLVMKIRPAGSTVWNGVTPKTPRPHGPAVVSVGLPYMSPLPAQPRMLPRMPPYGAVPISLVFGPMSDGHR